jgi:hypothetical protein
VAASFTGAHLKTAIESPQKRAKGAEKFIGKSRGHFNLL